MYNLELKIKDLARQKELSMRKICQKIDMSENGLALGLRNNTIKLDTLSKISEVLHIPITYFFTDSTDLPTVEVGKVQETKELAYPDAELVKYKKALHRERKRNDRLLAIIEQQAKH